MTPLDKAGTEPSSSAELEKKGSQTTDQPSSRKKEEIGRVKEVKGTRSQIFVGGVRKTNPRA